MSTSYKDYKNDPKTLYLKTNIDLSASTVVKGMYQKPESNTWTYITGAYNDHDGDSTNKWIKIIIPYETLDTIKTWLWHSYAEFAEHDSGEGVHGSVEKWDIYDYGE